MSLTLDFTDFSVDFVTLFQEDPYDLDYIFIKTSKNKDAILFRGYYYNHQRDNNKSSVYKCRHIHQKKECPATFTLNEDKNFRCKEHSHDDNIIILFYYLTI